MQPPMNPPSEREMSERLTGVAHDPIRAHGLGIRVDSDERLTAARAAARANEQIKQMNDQYNRLMTTLMIVVAVAGLLAVGNVVLFMLWWRA